MFDQVATRTFVPLLLRAALAIVFITHGLAKMSSEKSFGWNWAGDQMAGILQFTVALVELLGGVLIALGLFTRIAALAIIVIMVGAIFTVTGAKGFMVTSGGYEYNFVLILVSAALAIGGAGSFSFDRVVRVNMRGKSQY